MKTEDAFNSIQQNADISFPLNGEFIMKGVEDNGERIITCEAHTEDTDAQNQIVLLKALEDSEQYFVDRGNFDIGHYTQLSLPQFMQRPDLSRVAAVPRQYEIGQPRTVQFDRAKDTTRVAGVIYKGHELADWFWKTITEFTPPMRWFPSIGGKLPVIQKSLDNLGRPVFKVVKMLWTNVGFTQRPVNPYVGPVEILNPALITKALGEGITYEEMTGIGTNTISSLIKQDLEREAVSQLPGIHDFDDVLKQHGKVRPVLKAWLMNERGVDEAKAETLLDLLLADNIARTHIN